MSEQYTLKIPVDMRLLLPSETVKIDGKRVTIEEDNELVTVVHEVGDVRPNYFHHVKRLWLEETKEKTPFQQWNEKNRKEEPYLEERRKEGWNGSLDELKKELAARPGYTYMIKEEELLKLIEKLKEL